MSRIGKLPIQVPAGVDVTIDGRTVNVKGPKGSLSHTVVAPIDVARGDDGTIVVSRPNDERKSRALHGLSRTLVANMVTSPDPSVRRSPCGTAEHSPQSFRSPQRCC